MADYVNLNIGEDYISITFNVGNNRIMEIGSRMEEICEDAYMNGYNWEAFLNSYLEQNGPEIFDAIETDSEADMYCAYINDTSDEGKELAKQYVQILEDLFDNEEDIYDFLKHNADDIEWD